jgi:hypothetical protein
MGRLAGPEAMKVEGWQRLSAEYAKQFAAEVPEWAAKQITNPNCWVDGVLPVEEKPKPTRK